MQDRVHERNRGVDEAGNGATAMPPPLLQLPSYTHALRMQHDDNARHEHDHDKYCSNNNNNNTTGCEDDDEDCAPLSLATAVAAGQRPVESAADARRRWRSHVSAVTPRRTTHYTTAYTTPVRAASTVTSWSPSPQRCRSLAFTTTTTSTAHAATAGAATAAGGQVTLSHVHHHPPPRQTTAVSDSVTTAMATTAAGTTASTLSSPSLYTHSVFAGYYSAAALVVVRRSAADVSHAVTRSADKLSHASDHDDIDMTTAAATAKLRTATTSVDDDDNVKASECAALQLPPPPPTCSRRGSGESNGVTAATAATTTTTTTTAIACDDVKVGHAAVALGASDTSQHEPPRHAHGQECDMLAAADATCARELLPCRGGRTPSTSSLHSAADVTAATTTTRTRPGAADAGAAAAALRSRSRSVSVGGGSGAVVSVARRRATYNSVARTHYASPSPQQPSLHSYQPQRQSSSPCRHRSVHLTRRGSCASSTASRATTATTAMTAAAAAAAVPLTRLWRTDMATLHRRGLTATLWLASRGGSVVEVRSATQPALLLAVLPCAEAPHSVVTVLTALPDNRVAVGCSDGCVHVYDAVAAAATTTHVRAHTAAVTCMTYLDGRTANSNNNSSSDSNNSSDNNQDNDGSSSAVAAVAAVASSRLLTASADGTLAVWCVQSWQCVGRLRRGALSAVRALASSCGMRYAFTGHDTGELRLWDVQRLAQVELVRAERLALAVHTTRTRKTTTATTTSATAAGGASVARAAAPTTLSSTPRAGLLTRPPLLRRRVLTTTMTASPVAAAAPAAASASRLPSLPQSSLTSQPSCSPLQARLSAFVTAFVAQRPRSALGDALARCHGLDAAPLASTAAATAATTTHAPVPTAAAAAASLASVQWSCVCWPHERAHAHAVTSLCVVDDRLLISAGRDGAAHVYALPTGQRLHTLVASATAAATALRTSPPLTAVLLDRAAARVLLGSCDGVVTAYDLFSHHFAVVLRVRTTSAHPAAGMTCYAVLPSHEAAAGSRLYLMVRGADDHNDDDTAVANSNDGGSSEVRDARCAVGRVTTATATAARHAHAHATHHCAACVRRVATPLPARVLCVSAATPQVHRASDTDDAAAAADEAAVTAAQALYAQQRCVLASALARQQRSVRCLLPVTQPQTARASDEHDGDDVVAAASATTSRAATTTAATGVALRAVTTADARDDDGSGGGGEALLLQHELLDAHRSGAVLRDGHARMVLLRCYSRWQRYVVRRQTRRRVLQPRVVCLAAAAATQLARAYMLRWWQLHALRRCARVRARVCAREQHEEQQQQAEQQRRSVCAPQMPLLRLHDSVVVCPRATMTHAARAATAVVVARVLATRMAHTLRARAFAQWRSAAAQLRRRRRCAVSYNRLLLSYSGPSYATSAFALSTLTRHAMRAAHRTRALLWLQRSQQLCNMHSSHSSVHARRLCRVYWSRWRRYAHAAARGVLSAVQRTPTTTTSSPATTTTPTRSATTTPLSADALAESWPLVTLLSSTLVRPHALRLRCWWLWCTYARCVSKHTRLAEEHVTLSREWVVLQAVCTTPPPSHEALLAEVAQLQAQLSRCQTAHTTCMQQQARLQRVVARLRRRRARDALLRGFTGMTAATTPWQHTCATTTVTRTNAVATTTTGNRSNNSNNSSEDDDEARQRVWLSRVAAVLRAAKGVVLHCGRDATLLRDAHALALRLPLHDDGNITAAASAVTRTATTTATTTPRAGAVRHESSALTNSVSAAATATTTTTTTTTTATTTTMSAQDMWRVRCTAPSYSSVRDAFDATAARLQSVLRAAAHEAGAAISSDDDGGSSRSSSSSSDGDDESEHAATGPVAAVVTKATSGSHTEQQQQPQQHSDVSDGATVTTAIAESDNDDTDDDKDDDMLSWLPYVTTATRRDVLARLAMLVVLYDSYVAHSETPVEVRHNSGATPSASSAAAVRAGAHVTTTSSSSSSSATTPLSLRGALQRRPLPLHALCATATARWLHRRAAQLLLLLQPKLWRRQVTLRRLCRAARAHATALALTTAAAAVTTTPTRALGRLRRSGNGGGGYVPQQLPRRRVASLSVSSSTSSRASSSTAVASAATTTTMLTRGQRSAVLHTRVVSSCAAIATGCARGDAHLTSTPLRDGRSLRDDDDDADYKDDDGDAQQQQQQQQHDMLRCIHGEAAAADENTSPLPAPLCVPHHSAVTAQPPPPPPPARPRRSLPGGEEGGSGSSSSSCHNMHATSPSLQQLTQPSHAARPRLSVRLLRATAACADDDSRNMSATGNATVPAAAASASATGGASSTAGVAGGVYIPSLAFSSEHVTASAHTANNNNNLSCSSMQPDMSGYGGDAAYITCVASSLDAEDISSSGHCRSASYSMRTVQSLTSTPRSGQSSRQALLRPYLGFRVHVVRAAATSSSSSSSGGAGRPHDITCNNNANSYSGGSAVIVIKEVAATFVNAAGEEAQGPAAAAGLHAGDRLVRFAGYAVTDLPAFNAIVSRHVRPGIALAVEVARGDAVLHASIHVGARIG